MKLDPNIDYANVTTLDDVELGDIVTAVRHYTAFGVQITGVAKPRKRFEGDPDLVLDGDILRTSEKITSKTTLSFVSAKRPLDAMPTGVDSLIMITQIFDNHLDVPVLAVLQAGGGWFIPSVSVVHAAGDIVSWFPVQVITGTKEKRNNPCN